MTKEEQIRFALVLREAERVRERMRADKAAYADLDGTEMDAAQHPEETTLSVPMGFAA